MKIRASKVVLFGVFLVLTSPLVLAQNQARPPVRSTVKIPTTYGVIPRQKAIKVDAQVGDWPSPMFFIPLAHPAQVSGGLGHRGKGDLEGHAFVCWGPENLYVMIARRDDFFRAGSNLKRWGFNPAGPVGDGIYLKFDPRRDTRSLGNVPERKDDREFWIGVNDTDKPTVLRLDRRTGKTTREKGITARTRIEPRKKKTDLFKIWYELQIPWSLILPAEMKPENGLAIGFDIIMEDFDSPVDQLPQTRVGWTFAMGPILYPGNLGTLVLLAKPLPDGVKMRPAPPRPMPKKTVHPGVEPAEYWEDLSRELKQNPAPIGVPGKSRLDVLERLDRGLAAWPPMDLGSFLVYWHRGMTREFKGILDKGAPAFLKLRCREALSVFKEKPPGNGVVNIFKLPWSGWLIQSKFCLFAVDPFLPGLHQAGSRVDVQFLTNGLDPARRDDMLSMETFKAGLPFLSHVPVIIPRTDTDKMAIIKPGDGMNIGAAELLVLGPKVKDSITISQVAYDLRIIPDGPRMVFGGYNFKAEWITNLGKNVRLKNGGIMPIDVLSLPVGHPDLAEVVGAVKPVLYLPCDTVDFPRDPSGKADLRLAQVLKKLKGLAGVDWRLMVCGEKTSVRTSVSGTMKKAPPK